MSSDVPAILSERLALVSLSATAIEAVLQGTSELNVPADWPDAHDSRFLQYRASQMRTDPSSQQWLARAVVLASADRPVVGLAGFHGPPGINARADPLAVEIGYRIFEPHRRRGYATEVAGALMRWARDERGINRFIASVTPHNVPSLAVVRRLGFVKVGEHWDEIDGLELEFVRDEVPGS